MSLKRFLYYILTEDGRSGYVANGIVSYSGQPKPLPQTPDGWQDITLSWERPIDAHGINNNFSASLSFPRNGALIIRDALYKETINAKRQLLIQRLELQITSTTYNWFYKYFYRGQLDLINASDNQDVVKIPVNEGGLSKLVKANEKTVFEFPLSDREAINIRMDGISFTRQPKFVLLDDLEIQNDFYENKVILPLILTTDGTTLLGSKGYKSQDIEATVVAVLDYIDTSENWFAYNDSVYPITVILEGRLYGKITNGIGGIDFQFLINTATVESTYLISFGGVTDDEFDIPVSFSIPLQPGEKLFFYAETTVYFKFYQGSFINASSEFKYQPTTIKAFKRFDLYKKIIKKITGDENHAISQLCQDNDALVITCSDAIRGINGATVKTSLDDFRKDCDATFMAGWDILPDGIELEAREKYYDKTDYNVLQSGATNTDVFDQANNTLAYENILGLSVAAGDVIRIIGSTFNNGLYTVATVTPTITGFLLTFSKGTVQHDESGSNITIEKLEVVVIDLGIVRDFEIQPAKDFICNTFRFGHQKQNIDDVNGKYDPNGNNQFNGPITSLEDPKEYNQVSSYKAGPYEIETIRINLDGKKSTDDSRDNDVYVIATKKQDPVTGSVSFSNALTGMFIGNASRFAVGQQIRITGSASNDGVYDVFSITSLFIVQLIVFSQPVVDEGSVNVTIEWLLGDVYELDRPAYDTLELAIDPDTGDPITNNTVFNLPFLTPKTMEKRHGRWLAGINAGLGNKKIAFTSGKENKNTELRTVLGAVTIDENKDETIAELGDPLFLPWYFIFKAETNIELPALLEENPNRCFKFTDEYGIQWKGFLRLAGIAANDYTPQEYRMLAAPDNDILKLIRA